MLRLKGSGETKYAISQDEIKRAIENIPTSKSIIFLDTCESGSMASMDSSVKRFGDNMGRAIIAGATSKQSAIDGYKEHGIFTPELFGGIA